MRNILSLFLIITQVFIVTPSKAAITEPDRQQLAYRNEFTNGSFQNKSARWTASSGTLSIDTTNFFDGTQSGLMTMSASTGNLQSTVTPAQQYQGVSMEASCYVKTSLSTVSFCGMANGVETSCVAVPGPNVWTPVVINFNGPTNGQSIGVEIKSTSATGTYNVSGCYVGRSRNLSQSSVITPWTSYSLTIGGTTTAPTLGTTVANQALWRQVGDSAEISYTLHQTGAGTAGSGAYLFPLPSGLVIDTTKITLPSTQAAGSTLNSGATSLGVGNIATTTSGNANFSSVLNVSAYNSTNLTLAWQSNGGNGQQFPVGSASGAVGDLSNTIEYITFTAKVPIVGFSSNSSVINPSITPASWSGYHSGISGGCSTSSATYADPSACTSITLTQTTARNISCVTAASSLDGITCTLPRTGIYNVCATVQNRSSTASDISTRLVDGSGTVISAGSSTSMNAASYNVPNAQCGQYNATTLSAATFKAQIAVNTGTANITQGTATGSSAIQWSVTELDAAMPSPVLTSGSLAEIYVDGVIALGSAGSNKIYTFPTTEKNNGGVDITYARDTVNGDTMTMNNAGMYHCMCSGGGGSNQQGISINASSLTTSITSLTYANGRRGQGMVNGGFGEFTGFYPAGGIARCHSDAGGTLGGGNAFFSCSKLSQ